MSVHLESCPATRPSSITVCGISSSKAALLALWGVAALWIPAAATEESEEQWTATTAKTTKAPFSDDRSIEHLSEVACGCAWTRHNGCGLSGNQFIEAVTHSRIDEMCVRTYGEGDPNMTASKMDPGELRQAKADAEVECKLRFRIKELGYRFAKCLGLSARECAKTHDCQWGAQGANVCGIDEEEMVKELVGVHNFHQPLVELIVESDRCSKQGEQDCDGERYCQWNPHEGLCDLHPGQALLLLVEKANAVQTINLAYIGAQCHAWYEHGIDSPCTGICRLEYGVCRATTRIIPNREKEMLKKICEVSGRRDPVHNPNGECRRGCREKKDRNGKVECVADDSPMRSSGISSSDVEVARQLMALHSGTAFFERHCNAFDNNHSACMAVTDTCPQHYMPSLKGTWVAKERHDQGHAKADAIPGMNGVLGQLCERIVDGSFNDWIEEYLTQHPEDFEPLLRGLITRDIDLEFGGFSDMLLGPPPDMPNPYKKGDSPRPAPVPAPAGGGKADQGALPPPPGMPPRAPAPPPPAKPTTTLNPDIDTRPALQAIIEDIGMMASHVGRWMPRMNMSRGRAWVVVVGCFYIAIVAGVQCGYGPYSAIKATVTEASLTDVSDSWVMKMRWHHTQMTWKDSPSDCPARA